MHPRCPKCHHPAPRPSKNRTPLSHHHNHADHTQGQHHHQRRSPIVRHGSYKRKSDGTTELRFLCRLCNVSFSTASPKPTLNQKKRHLNPLILKLLCSSVSQRRCAKLLATNRKTITRKLLFLAHWAGLALKQDLEQSGEIQALQFDELETFEHTKMKPLSVMVAVEKTSRRILGLEVARMPATGLLASRSRQKYGPRPDDRPAARAKVYSLIAPFLSKNATVESDMKSAYRGEVARHFPGRVHRTYKGRRGCVVGQGELKATGFDELFSLNHTFAMIRDNVKRLSRRTWCTTKKPENLQAHLQLYALYHNWALI
ncbi:MAG: transposase [Bdellovibrionaceae bacterium]|nr:transposase [Pseudobdellovibrionaceae bacterium]